MLGWIPLLGPILQGLFSTVSNIYSKFKDTQVEQIKADVETTKVSAQIIRDTSDDIGIRILRDGALLFPVLWSMAIGWDTLIGGRMRDGTPWHPTLVQYQWHVPEYPASVGWLPYAALIFLLGNIGINAWMRRK